jgi:undecaprenyl-diphosphatase
LLHAVPGFSFPSGHSFSSFTFFGLLVYIIADSKKTSLPLKWLGSFCCLLIAATIAISRVYLRVHYPSDVIAGFLLCVIWLGISFWVLHLIRGKRFFET